MGRVTFVVMSKRPFRRKNYTPESNPHDGQSTEEILAFLRQMEPEWIAVFTANEEADNRYLEARKVASAARRILLTATSSNVAELLLEWQLAEARVTSLLEASEDLCDWNDRARDQMHRAIGALRDAAEREIVEKIPASLRKEMLLRRALGPAKSCEKRFLPLLEADALVVVHRRAASRFASASPMAKPLESAVVAETTNPMTAFLVLLSLSHAGVSAAPIRAPRRPDPRATSPMVAMAAVSAFSAEVAEEGFRCGFGGGRRCPFRAVRRAFSSEIAIAWSLGYPAWTSSEMLAEIVSREAPRRRGLA